MIPRISSIIAAPRIAFPDRVFNFPNSFSVSTVILTEVAVSTIPIKIFWRKMLPPASDAIMPGLLKKYARANPPASGTSTPQSAMIKDAFPLAFNSLISVSRPAQNIRTITPSSATALIKFVSVNTPHMAGPKISPAISAPTTCGICTFLVANPNNFVHSNITAKSNR